MAKKTLADQIKDLENTRAAKMARLEEIPQKSFEEGRSMDDGEREEFRDVKAELKQIDEELVELHDLEKMMRTSAAPASSDPKPTEKDFGKAKGPTIITQKPEPDEKFKGQNFTRMCIAKALSKEEQTPPGVIAERMWGKSNPRLVSVIKADVAGHGAASGDAGEELVHYNRYLGDFVEFLYSMTVYFRLPLREVPANINIGKHSTAATASWVGSGKGIPVTKNDTADVNLTPLKVAAIATAEKEWLRDGSPSGEMLIRDSLTEAAAQKIDGTFFSSDAAVAGVSPAGILWDLGGTVSAGTDDDGLRNDIKELVNKFIVAKNAGGLSFCMNPGLANSISLLTNALGQYAFDRINDEGGELRGKPVYTGHNIATTALILLKPSDIWRIGAGILEVSMSDVASIEMETAPAQDLGGPTAATGKIVSMFQTDSVAFKVTQSMNFQKRRASAVQWINDAAYGGSVST